MARGINKVILIGNLGNDPELRHFPSGDGCVCNVSIATSEQWKDKQTGQPRERTEWHRVVFYNRLAEIAGEYLRKGSKVYIEGSLRTRKWQDKGGVDHYTTEIVANEMQMLDGRPAGGQDSYAPPGQSYAPAAGAPAGTAPQAGYAVQAPAAGHAQAGYAQQHPQQQYPQQPAQGTTHPHQPGPPQYAVPDFDDDIPF